MRRRAFIIQFAAWIRWTWHSDGADNEKMRLRRGVKEELLDGGWCISMKDWWVENWFLLPSKTDKKKSLKAMSEELMRTTWEWEENGASDSTEFEKGHPILGWRLPVSQAYCVWKCWGEKPVIYLCGSGIVRSYTMHSLRDRLSNLSWLHFSLLLRKLYYKSPFWYTQEQRDRRSSVEEQVPDGTNKSLIRFYCEMESSLPSSICEKWKAQRTFDATRREGGEGRGWNIHPIFLPTVTLCHTCHGTRLTSCLSIEFLSRCKLNGLRLCWVGLALLMTYTPPTTSTDRHSTTHRQLSLVPRRRRWLLWNIVSSVLAVNSTKRSFRTPSSPFTD